MCVCVGDAMALISPQPIDRGDRAALAEQTAYFLLVVRPRSLAKIGRRAARGWLAGMGGLGVVGCVITRFGRLDSTQPQPENIIRVIEQADRTSIAFTGNRNNKSKHALVVRSAVPRCF